MTAPIPNSQLEIWQPNPGSQQDFISLNCVDEILMYGTRGNGKTEALLAKFQSHCGLGFGSYWRGIVFRKSYKNLDDIVIKSKRMFRGLHPSIRPRFMAGTGSYKWVWPTGEELLFRVMPDARAYDEYHGHEYPYIAWDELCNWANLKAYEAMISCNRSSYQGERPIPLIIVATTNPYGVGHGAVKAYFIDPAPCGNLITDKFGRTRIALFGHMRENPHLDEGYKRKLDSITDPNKRRAWLFGSWDVNSGGMFDDLWSQEIHRIEPFAIPANWKIDRAFDWGSSKPFSVGWFAESNGEEVTLRDGTKRAFPKGSVFQISEWYGCTTKHNEGVRMLAKNVAIGIREREARMKHSQKVVPGPADNSIWDDVDGHSIANNMLDEKIDWTRSNKAPGSRVQGWEYLRQMLENASNNEEKGFFVFSNCVQTLRCFPSAPRSMDNPDDVDCFVAGTMVSMPSGDKPIEEVRAGDIVNTPIGEQYVTKSYVSGMSETVKVTLSDGRVIEGTPKHPVMVEGKGLVYLVDIEAGQFVRGDAVSDSLKDVTKNCTLNKITGNHREAIIYRLSGDGMRSTSEVVRVEELMERKPVFNVTVNNAGLYYANGVLSSNTDSEDHIGDMIRYRMFKRAEPTIKGGDVGAGG